MNGVDMSGEGMRAKSPHTRLAFSANDATIGAPYEQEETVSKIGVLVPYAQIGEQTVAAARELGLEREVLVRTASATEAMGIAKELLAAGAEVLVARGNGAAILRRSLVGTPLVTVTLTCRDMHRHFREAQRITGLASPKIAVVAVQIMNQEVEYFVEAMGMRVRVYDSTFEIVDQTLEEIARDGMDIVVGGEITTGKARAAGLKALPLLSSVESMRLFLIEADRMRAVMALEQDRTRRFDTLVRNLREGVLYAEAGGRVRIVNPAAETMLERPAAEMIGKDLAAVLPLPDAFPGPDAPPEPFEDILTLGGSTYVAAFTPAYVGETPSGVIVSLQETNRIARMDGKIRENLQARGLAAPYRFKDIWGVSPAIRETKRLAAEYAPTASTVLIFGETGVGKELFAQSIHNAGRQAGGPFVAVNCAALPPALLESELFGYEEGAFTGANRRGKTGLIELAHNGTLFLDEVSELDRASQLRLLRFLQERQIMRVGGDRYVPVQTRVVAATNRDLDALVAAGEFREDLYYRLKVLTLDVPPLRDRKGDVRRLAERMRLAWEKELDRKMRIAPEVMPILEAHGWPGNVRELANVMENLAVTSRRPITGDMVRRVLLQRVRPDENDGDEKGEEVGREKGGANAKAPLSQKEKERRELIAALAAAEGNQSRAAKRLGVHRATLRRRMLVHGVTFEGLLDRLK